MIERAATLADAPAFGALIAGGFDLYRAFQPAGWEPPRAEEETARTVERLTRRGSWARLAVDGEEPAGCVLFEPAPEPEAAGVAHLANLFVARPWWGTGLAVRLHAAAVAAMRERGHRTGRLFTPAAQARARRFYEREGWRPAGPPSWGELLEMSLVEYRIELGDG
jgi:GNAT superfamily N-acetyltransferase